MKQIRSGVSPRSAVAGLTLLLVALIAAACFSGLPVGPRRVSPAPTAGATAIQPVPTASPTALVPLGPAAPTAAAQTEMVSNIPVGVDADGNFYRGNPNAAIKLVEFSDFQCPFCARHVLQTGPLLEETYIATGKVVAYFRHFPLQQLHPNALPASKAAYCAGQQAPRLFWAMHQWLFANQTSWSNAADAATRFRQTALSFGADAARYDACVRDPQTEARIARDLEDGMKLGVQGTPAFFINDWFLAGAYPFAEFQKLIAKADQGLRPPPTPTPLPPNVQPYDANPNRPGFTYDGSPSLGERQAPILIFVFSDFGCEACVEFARTVQPVLQDKYVKTGQVRLIYKYLAVSAPQTALAAFCAGDQDKFWEFADSLTANQGRWQEGDRAAMADYAKVLGLDVVRFETCVADAVGQEQLDADMALAEQIQVSQVPYFLVLNPSAQSGLRVPGLIAVEQFEKVIQDLQKPQSAAPGAAGQPTPAAVAVQRADQPVGVDMEGNFYRGDPRAPIRLVVFSDFQ